MIWPFGIVKHRKLWFSYDLGPVSKRILRQIVAVPPFTSHRATSTIFRKISFETVLWCIHVRRVRLLSDRLRIIRSYRPITDEGMPWNTTYTCLSSVWHFSDVHGWEPIFCYRFSSKLLFYLERLKWFFSSIVCFSFAWSGNLKIWDQRDVKNERQKRQPA